MTAFSFDPDDFDYSARFLNRWPQIANLGYSDQIREFLDRQYAAVREGKRREMLHNETIDLVLKLLALQSPSPVPSERAMRVAHTAHGLFHLGEFAGSEHNKETCRRIALLIDAEFGAKS